MCCVYYSIYTYTAWFLKLPLTRKLNCFGLRGSNELTIDLLPNRGDVTRTILSVLVVVAMAKVFKAFDCVRAAALVL